MSEWLTPKQAAGICSVAVSTLKAWRAAGVGPRYSAPNRRTIRYARVDIDHWLKSHVRETEH